MSVEFRILGPLEASVDGRPVALGGALQRATLAILLASANEVVPVERLVDGVWDEEPPGTAANVLQGYVSGLRKALGREAIATRGAGYSVVVPDGALDLHRFERLASGGPDDLADALALWRGPALADLAHLPGVRPLAARLDDLRLSALERRLEAQLERGSAAEVAADLAPLIAEHPYRERLRALRMRALYRDGRQAEALDEFRAARTVLVEALGIEPGPELHDLERAVLRQEPQLAAPTAAQNPPSRLRTIVAAAFAPTALRGAVAVAEALAGSPDRELVLAATLTDATALEPATQALRAIAAPLQESGVATRVAAFTSEAPGRDLARLAREQDAELLVLSAPEGLLADADVAALLEQAPCDVALVTGPPPGAGPVLVPFSGAEHDWAAVELGAWLAREMGRPLRLAGASAAAFGRDASRLLASASLALQRGLGVHADPVLVEPSSAGLLRAAGDAAVVAVGLTDRWRREGLGEARTALARGTGFTTVLVRRGLRPGGLAPAAGETRFTWTIAAGAGPAGRPGAGRPV